MSRSLRTISRYLRQIRVPFSQSYMWETLGRHAPIAARIVAFFHARFDPRLAVAMEERAQREAAILAEIETALADVPSLDEDRILRHFVNAMRAAIRTNFYQIDADGQAKPLIAIKFDSRKIDELPLPRPLYEIFVYSPRVEGVHLRFGKVARGGIRWSDRPQDFRTEILGLAKAQQVKNAVIVPVGAKGGFVPKSLLAGAAREAVAAEGVAAYKLFISSLLDITDNISPAGIVPPENVVRHDDDDPYLVVAADKGTASFSDIANEISLHAEFLAGRRLRLRRLRRLRPQGDGDHRARRLGGGEAAFPRDGRRYHQDAVHGRGRRRHVGRRLRQRHAARENHPARGGLRSPRHFHRPRSRPGKKLRRARAAVRAAALELAGLRQKPDLARRRRFFARAEGNSTVAADAGADRHRRRKSDAA